MRHYTVSIVGHKAEPRLPAATVAAPAKLRGWRAFKALRENFIALIPAEAFDRDSLQLQLLWQSYLLLSDPRDVQHVLHDHADRYARSPTVQRLFRRVLGESLITTEGGTWRRHRQIMAPAFTPRSIRLYAPLISRAIGALITRLRDIPDGDVVDLVAALRRLTVEIVARAMFSVDAPDEIEMVKDSVPGYVEGMRPGVLDLLPDWMPRPFGGRARRMVPGLDMAVHRLVARRRSGEQEHDLLSRMFAATASAQAMCIREVRDHAAHIYIAGHETTEQTLLWALYLLSQHPTQERKLQLELDRVLGGRIPTADDVPALPYARMVIEETMRLYPPAHTFVRKALVRDEIGGRTIAKGSLVLIVPWVLHRHRRLWENPETFDPERFRPERAAMRHLFAYVPFGGGPRICLGASLAMMESTLILAGIAQHYRFHPAPEQRIEPLASVTLRPRYGMTMLLERRSTASTHAGADTTS
jgi:cytochrome P450